MVQFVMAEGIIVEVDVVLRSPSQGLSQRDRTTGFFRDDLIELSNSRLLSGTRTVDTQITWLAIQQHWHIQCFLCPFKIEFEVLLSDRNCISALLTFASLSG